MNKLYNTISVCPVCLRTISAVVEEEQGEIILRKRCPEHGDFSTVIWQDSAENYLRWLRCGGVFTEKLPQSPKEAGYLLQGASFTGKACVQPCSAALMTTNRCNMDCPVCFTRNRDEKPYEPSLDECRDILRHYLESCGADAPLEFCGGEPTMRDDLPQMAQFARSLGFDYIQLNTNGIVLAERPEYCKTLKDSGITTVYLGFDGVTSKPYLAKYGRDMLRQKHTALENCCAAGLAVVLVTCVIPGENDDQLGEIVAYAKTHMPHVRGVYFQPISYFGIYDENQIRRITIPEILRKLEQQTAGELRVRDFLPGAYEHAQCSFNACYVPDKDKTLKALTRFCDTPPCEKSCHRIRQSIKRTWLPGKTPMLTVGGMAFQDAWNIDLLRVRRCSVQIIGKNRTMMPLCSQYLTSCQGVKLNEGIC